MRWILALVLVLASCAPLVAPGLPPQDSGARLPGLSASLWPHQAAQIYFEQGGSGPPVLLIHDVEAGMDSSIWRRNTVALLEAGYRVIALDLLGYGRSSRLNMALTPADLIALLEAFLSEVVAEPAVLIAQGRSAAYAIEVAARRPESVTGLVLVAPSGYRVHLPRGDVAQQLERLRFPPGLFPVDPFERRASPAGMADFLRRLYFDASLITPELVASYQQNLSLPGSNWSFYSVESGSLNHSVAASWPQLTQPTLLVWGLENTDIPIASAEDFLLTRPEVEFKFLTGARVAVQDERGLAFNAIIVEFLLRRRQ